MTGQRKVVIVTGCSEGGIGFHLCKEYASKGCKVYATARRVEAMASLTGPNIEQLRMDVTDAASVKFAVNEIIEREGRIDVLVNNAGIICNGPLAEQEMDRIQQTFDVNVFGILRTIREVLPHMATRKSGTIVNISSGLASIPLPFAGVYSATKAAVDSLSEALYMECLPLGIAVVLVGAGGVSTNIVNNMGANFTVPPTALYSDYARVIAASYDPSADNMARTSPERFARVVVGKSLAKLPARFVAVGSGATLVRLVAWLPRGFALRQVWKFMVEKRRVSLAKSQ